MQEDDLITTTTHPNDFNPFSDKSEGGNEHYSYGVDIKYNQAIQALQFVANMHEQMLHQWGVHLLPTPGKFLENWVILRNAIEFLEYSSTFARSETLSDVVKRTLKSNLHLSRRNTTPNSRYQDAHQPGLDILDIIWDLELARYGAPLSSSPYEPNQITLKEITKSLKHINKKNIKIFQEDSFADIDIYNDIAVHYMRVIHKERSSDSIDYDKIVIEKTSKAYENFMLNFLPEIINNYIAALKKGSAYKQHRKEIEFLITPVADKNGSHIPLNNALFLPETIEELIEFQSRAYGKKIDDYIMQTVKERFEYYAGELERQEAILQTKYSRFTRDVTWIKSLISDDGYFSDKLGQYEKDSIFNIINHIQKIEDEYCSIMENPSLEGYEFDPIPMMQNQSHPEKATHSTNKIPKAINASMRILFGGDQENPGISGAFEETYKLAKTNPNLMALVDQLRWSCWKNIYSVFFPSEGIRDLAIRSVLTHNEIGEHFSRDSETQVCIFYLSSLLNTAKAVEQKMHEEEHISRFKIHELIGSMKDTLSQMQKNEIDMKSEELIHFFINQSEHDKPGYFNIICKAYLDTFNDNGYAKKLALRFFASRDPDSLRMKLIAALQSLLQLNSERGGIFSILSKNFSDRRLSVLIVKVKDNADNSILSQTTKDVFSSRNLNVIKAHPFSGDEVFELANFLEDAGETVARKALLDNRETTGFKLPETSEKYYELLDDCTKRNIFTGEVYQKQEDGSPNPNAPSFEDLLKELFTNKLYSYFAQSISATNETLNQANEDGIVSYEAQSGGLYSPS